MTGELMSEPRAVMFGEFLTQIRNGFADLKKRHEQNDIAIYADPEGSFANDEAWRMDSLELACQRLHKQYNLSGPIETDWKQIAIEMGYYVRESSPFNMASQYTQYNAISCGKFSNFFAMMCLSAIGDKLKDVNWDFDNDSIMTIFNDEEQPSLRSVISIGEQVFDLGRDFFAIINMGREQVETHIQRDDMIVGASWYWESVGEDLMKHNAMIGSEAFDAEDDGVSKCNADEYLEEWYWDILSGQYAWNDLDWMLVGEWGCLNKSLQDMVEDVIKRQMGKDIKNDFFPDDDDLDSWRSDNV